jgi:predicted RND superfamily exporter protein
LTLTEESRNEYLFVPRNARGWDDRETVKRLFPTNFSEFDGGRRADQGAALRVIVTSKSSNASVIRPEIVSEILRLDGFITNLSLPLSYWSICAKWGGECVRDPFIQFLQKDTRQFLSLQFTFPATEDGFQLGGSLGGVDFVSTDQIRNALAVRLAYWLHDNSTGQDWQNSAVKQVEKFESDFISVLPVSTTSLDNEINSASGVLLRLFIAAFAVLIMFAVLSLTMLDWVRSKVVVGLFGVLSPCLAVLASLGLLSTMGLKYSGVIGVMPFLILGIGVDDMFIIVESFRHTSPRDSIETRLSGTLAKAAVSITITSVTDFLAFMIGAVSVYPSVFAFCIFASTAIIFDLILQLTFFAACIFYDTKREHANRHGLSMCVVLPKSLSKVKTRRYQLFCSGGVMYNSQVVEEQQEHLASKLLKKHYGPFLMKKPVKVTVIVVLVAYLAISIYGCTRLEKGNKIEDLTQDGSVTQRYFLQREKYFTLFTHQVSFIKTTSADYWNKSVQQEMDSIIADVVASQFVSSSQAVSWWLHSYINYLQITKNITDISQFNFMQILQDEFLKLDRYSHFKLDIHFSENRQQIEATRFLVVTSNVSGPELEEAMLIEFRKIADRNGLIAYNVFFVFFDHLLALVPSVFQTIGIALGAMLIVALLIIPYPLGALLAMAAILSTVVGVIGLMHFWGVRLDTTAMITIIMSIGFSVDSSVHIIHAFAVSPEQTQDRQAIDALHHLGYPVVQGSVSTVLSVLPIAFAGMEIFRSFFKTLFLVITLGFMHGIAVLPVILSLLGPAMKTQPAMEIDDAEKDTQTLQEMMLTT